MKKSTWHILTIIHSHTHTYKMTWTAALVDGFTQSRKTWKAFELIAQHAAPESKTLVLFITQANCIAATNQVLARAKQDARLTAVIDPINIIRGTASPSPTHFNKSYKHNIMLVDFWNSRNTRVMYAAAKAYAPAQVFIVIDEAEQAGIKGVKNRLAFVQRMVSQICVKTRIIFVTATVANLSKCILTIATEDSDTKKDIVRKIIDEPCVKHFYVPPHADYVSPSWFFDNNLWVPLVFPRRPRKPSTKKKDPVETSMPLAPPAPPQPTLSVIAPDRKATEQAIVVDALNKLSPQQKEFCLVVTSTRQSDQKNLISDLLSNPAYDASFNVIIEANSDNSRNFIVYYKTECKKHKIKSWSLPFKELEMLALQDALAPHVTIDDITLPYMLQSCIFMKTIAHHDRILQNVKAPEEAAKLTTLSEAILTKLPPSRIRPKDFPNNPRVALVAGHIAGRGTTIQLASIDLACTSFCFTGSANTAQCGATNAQRFGRACGMLGDIFIKRNKPPILIASQQIIQDAIANEVALRDKAAQLQDGEMVSLQSLVTKDEWQGAVQNTKASIKERVKPTATATEPQAASQDMTPAGATNAVIDMLKAAGGECSLSWASIKEYNTDLYTYLRKQNKRTVNEMMAAGIIVKSTTTKSAWRLT